MGIDMRWIDERGKVLGELLDPESRVPSILPPLSTSDSLCLRFVDPYGDAVFNRFQIPTLIAELDGALSLQTDPAVRQHIDSMLALARKTEGSIHTYIKFYGD